MKTKNEIIIDFLFPKFSKPNVSRFISSFLSHKKAKDNSVKPLHKSPTISIERIHKGEDKRTSVMIKNIPSGITKSHLNEILSNVGNINYLYIPHDKSIKKSLAFAFVNVINYKNVANLYHKLNGVKLKNFDMKRPLEICYSKVQGKAELAKMFGKKEYPKM